MVGARPRRTRDGGAWSVDRWTGDEIGACQRQHRQRGDERPRAPRLRQPLRDRLVFVPGTERKFSASRFHTWPGGLVGRPGRAGARAAGQRRVECGPAPRLGIRCRHHSRARRCSTQARHRSTAWRAGITATERDRSVARLRPDGTPQLRSRSTRPRSRRPRQEGLRGRRGIDRRRRLKAPDNTIGLPATALGSCRPAPCWASVGFLSRPVCLPVLARLWRPRHTGKIAHARELAELIAARYPDRMVHVVGDAAYVGEHLRNLDGRITWTSRLKVTSVLHELPPPRTGRSGRPRTRGARLGTPTDLAASATARGAVARHPGPPLRAHRHRADHRDRLPVVRLVSQPNRPGDPGARQ